MKQSSHGVDSLICTPKKLQSCTFDHIRLGLEKKFFPNKITQPLETFHPSLIRIQQVKGGYLSSFLKTMISDDFDRRRISQPKPQ